MRDYIALGRTAAQRGAHLINYCGVTGLLHTDGKVGRRVARGRGNRRTIQGQGSLHHQRDRRLVDGLRRQDDEHAGREEVEDIVAPSQGVHVVVDREFMPSITR